MYERFNSQLQKMDKEILNAIPIDDIPSIFININELNNVSYTTKKEIDRLYESDPEIQKVLKFKYPLKHLRVFWLIRDIPNYKIRDILIDAYNCQNKGKIMTNFYMLYKYLSIPYSGPPCWFGVVPIICFSVLMILFAIAVFTRIFGIVVTAVARIIYVIFMYLVCIADINCDPTNWNSFPQYLK